MDITTVTVVHRGVTLDCTNLTQGQKQHLADAIVNSSGIPDVDIPAVDGRPAMKMRELADLTQAAGTPHTAGSVTFTFIRPA